MWSGTLRATGWTRLICESRDDHGQGQDQRMSVQIFSASLESHQADLIVLFRRYLTPDSDENRFNWLYKQNPCGRARVWLASDGENGTIIGAAAAFPRRYYFHGTERLGWVLGDFCLAEQYRSMGPALQLQRACMRSIEPPDDFCYDFPSKSMMAIYKRLGVEQTSNLVRWARPLRVEDKLKSIVRSKSAARALSRIGNAVLDSRGWKGTKAACEIELHHGPCGEEFTVLDQSLRTIPGLRAARTAGYLNWRYLAHPSRAHSILVARQKGALVGYIVVRSEVENGRIVDIASLEQPAAIARLIDAAVGILRLGGAQTVSLAAGDGHPWGRLFERAGFRRRETSPIVVVSRRGATVKETDFKSQCYLMEGERDS